jgi:hypothetical protein
MISTRAAQPTTTGPEAELRPVETEPTAAAGHPVDRAAASAQRPGDLIDAKAQDLLGMTGQEFVRAWYSRQFVGATRPEVVAMDRLMRTGRCERPD